MLFIECDLPRLPSQTSALPERGIQIEYAFAQMFWEADLDVELV